MCLPKETATDLTQKPCGEAVVYGRANEPGYSGLITSGAAKLAISSTVALGAPCRLATVRIGIGARNEAGGLFW